jgi:choline dehydrogenase-like flavoprotein
MRERIGKAMRMSSHDFVVVGAGSAGCALAARLGEAGARVLVLEAGGSDRNPNVWIPAAFPKQFKTKLDWDFQTEPEEHCGGRSLYIPRGKSVGGSSSMNAMIYMRGRPSDYDGWRDRGADGWGWSDLLPYFRKAEGNVRGESELHGGDGPVVVSEPRSPRPLTKLFIEAAINAGLPANKDFNGPTQAGVGMNQTYTKNGRRWSAADAYLRPALKRHDVELVTHAHVTAVDFDGDRATGVRYRDRRGRDVIAKADREVVVAAGAICSPQLLMLSGIGPADELKAHGIAVRSDLGGVGQNLHDHPYVVGVWESGVGGSLADAEKPKALLEYLLRRSGPLTSNVGEACAFVPSRDGLPEPDLQFHFGPAYFVENGFATFDGHAFTLGPVLVSTHSRGDLRLRSANPSDKPRIRTNTFADARDLEAVVAGIRIAREIAATEPLAGAARRELLPGAGIESDEQLAEDARRRVELLYHPVGTCAIGDVVDAQLRVKGVEGLRVADASVMPQAPGGNTNAAAIVIGEKAADLLLDNSRQ